MIQNAYMKTNYLLTLVMLIFGSFVHGQTIATNANDVCPIKMGQELPNTELTTIDSKPINLLEVTGAQPTVIIFYRGSWCPYCNRQLAALQEKETALKKLGFQIIAISPDKPENLQKSPETPENRCPVFRSGKIFILTLCVHRASALKQVINLVLQMI